jgi:LysM repeat protein
MKLKVPEFLTRLPAVLKRKPSKARPPQKLRAATATRRMSPAMDDDLDEEPTTRLSSAFFVVLILHLVAVGGIWAFNSIKAHRRVAEPSASVSAKKAAAQPAVDAKPAAVSASAAPAPVEARPQTPLAAPIAPAPALAASGIAYQVKQGDTLSKIALTLGVTVAEIKALNDPKDIVILKPGQTIKVPARKTTETAAAGLAQKKGDAAFVKTAGERTHQVEKGETATSIAKRYGVGVDDLVALNKLKDPKKLQLGQTLKVPAKKVN